MNNPDKSEAESISETIMNWINREYGETVVFLGKNQFYESDPCENCIRFVIQNLIGTFNPYNGLSCYEYVWTDAANTNMYEDFCLGNEHAFKNSPGTFRVYSVFQIADFYINNDDVWPTTDRVKTVLRKLRQLKDVSSLAELELRLAALGEN